MNLSTSQITTSQLVNAGCGCAAIPPGNTPCSGNNLALLRQAAVLACRLSSIAAAAAAAAAGSASKAPHGSQQQ
jgi:hypothetical protein